MRDALYKSTPLPFLLIFLYADNANCNKICCHEDSEKLQLNLHRLSDWPVKWLLQFHLGKCKTMHFGKSSFNTQYSMQDSNGNNQSSSHYRRKGFGNMV